MSRVAAAANIPVFEVGLDSSDRLSRFGPESGLLNVSMHGDYRYDQLRNTPAELQHADATIRRHLVDHVRDVALVVVGYSGRDESVMDALDEAYSKGGPGALYWCEYDAGALPPRRATPAPRS